MDDGKFVHRNEVKIDEGINELKNENIINIISL